MTAPDRDALLERALKLLEDHKRGENFGSWERERDALLAGARPEPVKEAIKTISIWLGPDMHSSPEWRSGEAQLRLERAWDRVRAALDQRQPAAAIDEEAVRKRVEGEIADWCMADHDGEQLSVRAQKGTWFCLVADEVRSGAYRKAPKP